MPLPGFAGRLARLPTARGLLGDFLTGAFATLLATPCTAPFLATALGFALAGGPAEIFGIFLALGIGLGAPYLLVAAAPALARYLPRPGPWMIWLKRALGFALLRHGALAALSCWPPRAASARQPAAGAALIAVLVLLAWRRLGRVCGAGGLVAAGILRLAGAGGAGQRAAGDGGSAGRRLAALRRSATSPRWSARAMWCWSMSPPTGASTARSTSCWCSTAAGRPMRSRPGKIVGLKADWTRPDPAIARYLASFGRYGIPFNAVYGPKAPQGLPLPPVLSEEAVRQASWSRRATAASKLAPNGMRG